MKRSEVYDILEKRHELLKSIRTFFFNRGYIEVETANLMRTPPPDPNIDPLEVFVGDKGPFYLHTSPEMGMKKLLPAGHNRIFQICKVYRVEEFDEIHSTEFTMLEWYREGAYIETMRETNDLISYVAAELPVEESQRYQKDFATYTLEDLFLKKTGINPFGLTRDGLFEAMKKRGFPGINDGDDLNSLFFKLFIQEIEPAMPKDSPYFITGWPALISTMAKAKDNNSSQVERFELYMRGLEIANGYTELTDPAIQMKRFADDNQQRQKLGKAIFGIDDEFLSSLGDLTGSYTGVSIGIDRLLMALFKKTRIDEVLPARFTG